MNEETHEEAEAFQDFAEDGLEKLTTARETAEDALAAATDYVRNNPWVAVAGAAVLGGVIVALARPSRPASPNLDAVRDFLDDTYAKLPSRKEARSGLNGLLKKLHLA